MTAGRFLYSVILATVLLVACHLMIRFGAEDLYHWGMQAFMPGATVELMLSGNPIEGFGDWRTFAVINTVTWVLCWVVAFIGLRLWVMVVGK